MGTISKEARNELPKIFRELVRKRDKRLFTIFNKEFIKAGRITPDESIVFDYLDDLVKLQKNYRHKSRISSFSMLEIPVGAELHAVFDDGLKFVTLDAKNMIRDLQDGDEMPISRMAVKYLGGSKNGYDWFTYQGRRLSEIRLENDPDYLK